jgi:hypothetical protein
MNKFILTFFFSSLFIVINAQTLKGVLYDESEKLPVNGATVKIADTANAALTVITDKLGTFSFKNLAAGSYKISISSL